MTATSVPRNRLLAQSDREFDLWQACHEFAEKSSKIVPLGAPAYFPWISECSQSGTRSLDASVDAHKRILDENASNHLSSV
jgi:hypothetical protein